MRKISFYTTVDYTRTDNELIKQILLGDSSAFEVIYERYSKQLYNYVLTLLNFNTEEAGLVLSDVFIKAYEYLQQKSIENLKGLLYKIAHNTSVDWIRTHERQEILFPEEVEQYIDPKDVSQKQNIDTHYKRKLLKSFLSQLEEKYSAVLYLLYYEDKSYDEIAIIQQSNKNSIGTLVFQGKKKLEDIMRKAAIDPDIFLI